MCCAQKTPLPLPAPAISHYLPLQVHLFPVSLVHLKSSFPLGLHPVPVSASGPRTSPLPGCSSSNLEHSLGIHVFRAQPPGNSPEPGAGAPKQAMGRALGPEISALAPGVHFATSCLHVQRQATFRLRTSASSSVKWALLPAWPTSQKLTSLNLRIEVQVL